MKEFLYTKYRRHKLLFMGAILTLASLFLYQFIEASTAAQNSSLGLGIYLITVLLAFCTGAYAQTSTHKNNSLPTNILRDTPPTIQETAKDSPKHSVFAPKDYSNDSQNNSHQYMTTLQDLCRRLVVDYKGMLKQVEGNLNKLSDLTEAVDEKAGITTVFKDNTFENIEVLTTVTNANNGHMEKIGQGIADFQYAILDIRNIIQDIGLICDRMKINTSNGQAIATRIREDAEQIAADNARGKKMNVKSLLSNMTLYADSLQKVANHEDTFLQSIAHKLQDMSDGLDQFSGENLSLFDSLEGYQESGVQITAAIDDFSAIVKRLKMSIEEFVHQSSRAKDVTREVFDAISDINADSKSFVRKVETHLEAQ